MIIKKHEEIKFENDKSKEDEMPPLEDYNDIVCQVDEKILVIERTLDG